MLADILEQRRSYRSLEKIPIERKTLFQLAIHASLMPSCFNNQPWRFVFISSPEQLEKLKTTYSKGNEWAYNASFVVAVVTRDSDDCQLQGKTYAGFDTGMSVGAMLLSATEMELVLHPIAGFDTEKAKDILGIPKDFTLITLLIGGKKNPMILPELTEKQKEAELQRPPRKKPEEFAFLNSWNTPLRETDSDISSQT
jgi:nitroreductase